mmetsp:Transcript_4734/g.8152  ORF Transcript_4734/g.8152 Transcript_4734/m.8152 type:complete len:120 (-) Transcript_4734:42-401(-)
MEAGEGCVVVVAAVGSLPASIAMTWSGGLNCSNDGGANDFDLAADDVAVGCRRHDVLEHCMDEAECADRSDLLQRIASSFERLPPEHYYSSSCVSQQHQYRQGEWDDLGSCCDPSLFIT